MAEKSTIARPYAEAVFALAQEADRLPAWSDLLQTVAAVTTDTGMQSLIGNTSLSKTDLAQLITDLVAAVASETLTGQDRNLIALLAENRRLDVITEIAEQFEVLKAEAEKTVEAEIVTATEITTAQQVLIASKLRARLGRKVSLKSRVDDSLMGGAIIKAGDLVIDGSVRGQLNKLSVELAG